MLFIIYLINNYIYDLRLQVSTILSLRNYEFRNLDISSKPPNNCTHTEIPQFLNPLIPDT